MTAPEDRVARIHQEWVRERPDLDTSPQEIIGRLHRVALLLTERLERLYRDFDLSEAEFDLLAALRRAGSPFERDAGELAEHTMVTSGGLTKRVDRLAARGLVERTTHDGDGRRRRVRLTPAGRTLIDEAFTAHMANEHAILDELTPGDRDALHSTLTTWLGLLESERASGNPSTTDAPHRPEA